MGLRAALDSLVVGLLGYVSLHSFERRRFFSKLIRLLILLSQSPTFSFLELFCLGKPCTQVLLSMSRVIEEQRSLWQVSISNLELLWLIVVVSLLFRRSGHHLRLLIRLLNEAVQLRILRLPWRSIDSVFLLGLVLLSELVS